MARTPSSLHRWILLGRVLPRRTRERVFEPAFYDLLRRCLRSPRAGHVQLGGRTVGILAGSCAVAAQRVLLSRRTAILAAALIACVLVLGLLRSWLLHVYAGSPAS